MSLSTAFARIVGALLRESTADHVRVETMEDEVTLVCDDGALVSMIALDGALRSPGAAEFDEIVERLRLALAPYLSQPGHVLEIVFRRDPETARREIDRLVDQVGRGARDLGLDVDDVLDERRAVLSARMVDETCLVTVHTRPDVLGAEEAADESRKAAAALKAVPVAVGGQNPAKCMGAVHVRHAALVDALHRAFVDAGQVARILDVVSALREMRAGLHPLSAAERDGWTPRLPSWAEAAAPRAGLVMAPESVTEMSGRDFGCLFPPSFARQLALDEAHVLDSKTVQIGEAACQAFDMTLAPEVLVGFDALVRDVTSKDADLPWRASIRIESGGLQAMALKNLFLSLFTFAAPVHNRRIRDMIAELRDVDGRLDSVVRLRISFATWASASNLETLRRRGQVLLGAVQRWGNARADGVSGDPFATLLSTVPGIGAASTAPVAAGPLGDVLSLCPLSRQGRPWSSGGVLLRTEDGRIWPYQPGSSRQATWVTLLVGTPGSGKSVMLNAINFAAAITPTTVGGARPELPRIAIIDIGASSSGLISLVREALPPERRHEAVFRKLRMSPDDGINVFDTQLGMRAPTTVERAFLINFVSLLCSDGETAPSAAMRGLIAAAIDQAYRDFADDRRPRRHLPGDAPEVDAALDRLGVPPSERTSWWRVVDRLAEAGLHVEAEIAQRHAVPTLGDLVTASQVDQVASLYGGVSEADTGQSLLSAFQRMISEAVRDLPILAGHTRFSIGSARIAALDLMEVAVGGASAGARRQTAIMYMLARHVLARDFFLDEAEFLSAARSGLLPALHVERHLVRARECRQAAKLICLDEFHRTRGIESICEQIQQDAREGRKFNVDLKIASQLIEDFPRPILEIASSLFVCSSGAESSIDALDAIHRLGESERAVLRRELVGPGPGGAPLWALFRLRDEGMARQKLVLTLGPVELWAFSTTAEDVALRSRLYDLLGPRRARRALARRFPSGSAKSEIESRVARLAEREGRGGDGLRADVIGDLVEDLRRQAMMMEARG